jgi:hypothetical protein
LNGLYYKHFIFNLDSYFTRKASVVLFIDEKLLQEFPVPTQGHMASTWLEWEFVLRLASEGLDSFHYDKKSLKIQAFNILLRSRNQFCHLYIMENNLEYSALFCHKFYMCNINIKDNKILSFFHLENNSFPRLEPILMLFVLYFFYHVLCGFCFSFLGSLWVEYYLVFWLLNHYMQW